MEALLIVSAASMKLPISPPTYLPAALLVVRLAFGLMMFSHGLGKVQQVFGGDMEAFADPIGIGKPASLVLAAFAEGLCSLLVAVGSRRSRW
jgi:uncharacterized membrane protein YphA (DoxX/SURF4 family)